MSGTFVLLRLIHHPARRIWGYDYTMECIHEELSEILFLSLGYSDRALDVMSGMKCSKKASEKGSRRGERDVRVYVLVYECKGR